MGRAAAAAAFVSCLAGATADAAPAKVRAAWDGVARLGAYTEIEIVIDDGTALPAAIEVGPDGAAAQIRAELGVDAPSTVTLPYRVDTAAPVTLRLLRGSRRVHEASLDLFDVAPGRRVVALAMTDPARPGVEGVMVRRVTASALPKTGFGYDALSALVLDGNSLRALASTQLAALEDHLAGCGRVVAVGMSRTLAEGLRAIAGCGGAFLETVGAPPEIRPALSALLAHEPPALPRVSELDAVSPCAICYGDILGAAGLLAGFAGVTAILLVSGRLVLAAGAIGLATLLAIALGSLQTPLVESVSWTETTSGDRAARNARLLRIIGGGDDRTVLPPMARIARSSGAGLVRTVEIGGGGERHQLAPPTEMFSRATVAFQSVAIGPNPTPSLAWDGTILRNDGKVDAKGVVIAAPQGGIVVGDLGAGAAWTRRPGDAPEATGGAAARLASRRAGKREDVVLADGGGGWIVVLPANAGGDAR